MKNTTQQLFAFDQQYNQIIAGVDEVGRGPLAGPVVCACVVMPLDIPIDGINDSKKISKAKLESLYQQITQVALDYSVQAVDHTTIDQINILQATKQCMRQVISSIRCKIDIVLVDYVNLGDTIQKITLQAITKGDATSYNIAAASIVAKVTRDRLMQTQHTQYPQYGFDTNVGYGTPKHIQAIQQYGISPIHRKTFCQKWLNDPNNEQKASQPNQSTQ